MHYVTKYTALTARLNQFSDGSTTCQHFCPCCSATAVLAAYSDLWTVAYSDLWTVAYSDLWTVAYSDLWTAAYSDLWTVAYSDL